MKGYFADWRSAGRLLAAAFAGGLATAASAQGVDPYASNNGKYPTADAWSGPFRSLNFDYPDDPIPSKWNHGDLDGPITLDNAARYLAALTAFVAPSMRKMVETPDDWDPRREGWYGMIWSGAADNACDGREPILGSFSGQVILEDTFADSGLTTDMQNFTVIYYDETSAAMLGELWADPFNPSPAAVRFPEGGMVVKAAAVTPTPEQWPILEGAAVWNVFRPPFDPQTRRCDPSTPAEVQPLRVLQFDVIVKDALASPETGWVFATFLYDKDAPGEGTWDRLVPLGAQWGNDPDLAEYAPDDEQELGPLQETWINPDAPAYTAAALGWGGRLSGPIDVSQRHNVVLTDGTRVDKLAASACMSCHSAAQFPITANLYPSPNASFPPEGDLFPMYVPGSPEWARWFQNRPGQVPLNRSTGSVGLDYDMLIMFSLGAFNAEAGNDAFMLEDVDVH